MSTEVIVALITVCGTVGANMLSNYFLNNKKIDIMEERFKAMDSKIEMQINGIKEDIDVLSKRVDKHNNLIERMAKVEESTKSAHHRIDELM